MDFERDLRQPRSLNDLGQGDNRPGAFVELPPPDTSKPAFQPGQMFDKAALVVDSSGQLWWIDPCSRVLKKAEVDTGVAPDGIRYHATERTV